MDIKAKVVTGLIAFLLLINNFSHIYADSEYIIADASSGEYEELTTLYDYDEAISQYNQLEDEYDNLVLLCDEKVIKMEYGIVNFINNNSKEVENYSSDINGDAYINPAYVGDAAYLRTSSNGKYVDFVLAGDRGTIGFDSIELIPFELLNVRISQYSIENNKLYHNIKTNLNHNYYSNNILLDEKPDYLNDNESYYSYDGHFFYDDFKLMIDDYRNDEHVGAINSDNPYFNYYQYLPHRSYTNYSVDEIEDYFTNTLFLDGKIQFYDDLNLDQANDDVNLSQMYNEWPSFFCYEKIYGANAMMISLAVHESSYGKSFLAFSKNNLFGHAAYDSDAERSASRYNNIDSSIYSHAKYYISRSYAGVHSNNYHGSFFGNKKSGMNVMYSSDPYWGEAACSNYFKFDEALGFKDKNSYALGIIEDEDDIKVYKNDNLRNLSFEVEGINTYSVILLEELEDAYKIQVDASYSDEYLYDPEKSIGYIRKDYVDYIINEEKICEKEYKTVSFDLMGGELNNKEKIEMKVLNDSYACVSSPNKEGYEFVGYNIPLSLDTNEYEVQYKKINKIEMVSDFISTIEYNKFYNLKGGKLKVYYEDGTNKIININTNMLESFDSSIEGNTDLVINYCGLTINYPVYFSKELSETHATLDEYLEKNIASYKKDGTYDLKELDYIKKNLKRVDYLTTFDHIRYIDAMLLEKTRDDVNYHFKESNYDISISGLALSLKDPKLLNVFKPFKDTYYVECYDLSKDSYNRLKSVAESYGFDIEDSLRISVSYNLARAKFDNPIIIELKIQDKKQDKIYTVYHLDDDNNVIKCMTTQSNNYISFMTRSEGDFMILSKDSFNTYEIKDAYENMSTLNADPDNHSLFLVGDIIISMGLYGFVMIIIYHLYNRRREKKWNDYKKLLQEAESHHVEKQKN